MLAIVTLTKGGAELARRIENTVQADVFYKPKPFKEKVHELYRMYDQILFIMATGIVVRTLSGVMGHKSEDPAIVVMDEKGHFAISLLSGHLGGANILAKSLADITGGQPVITTASDVNGLLSVDMFALKYNLILEDYESAKVVTSYLVDHKPLQLIGMDVSEEKYEQEGEAIVYVGHEFRSFDKPFVQLRRKNLVLGVGCKRDTTSADIMALIKRVFQKHHLSIASICKITSAWLKADEKGLIEVAEILNVAFETYELDDLKKVSKRFETSEFVEKTIGVGNVSEPSGYLGSNLGNCLVGIVREQGITLSIWENRTCCTL